MFDRAHVLAPCIGHGAGRIQASRGTAQRRVTLSLTNRYKAASPCAQAKSVAAAATKQPDGQISKILSSLRAKNIPLLPSGKSGA
jgi:hypothetical protein